MEPMPRGLSVIPDPRIPKVFGILNIVFASALMICGLCSVAYYASIPVFSKAMTKLQNDAQAKADGQRKIVLESYDEQEAAATTEEAKAEVRAKRQQYEAESKKPPIPKVDFGMMGLEGSRIRTYIWLEFLTGLILNVLLLTSGIGLVMRRTWGLKLGLGVAVLKVARLLGVYGYAALVMAPTIAKGMAEFQVKTIAGQQGGQPLPPGIDVETVTRWMSLWFSACAVGMILFGSIYPLVQLWLLSRPAARAACSDAPQPPARDGSW